MSSIHDKPNEADWKVFRKMVPDLRERYLQARNDEFILTLTDKALSPTEQFWEVEKRTTEIARVLRACLDGHSRSKMELFIRVMLRYEMMSEEDLSVFSSELRERMKQRLSD